MSAAPVIFRVCTPVRPMALREAEYDHPDARYLIAVRASRCVCGVSIEWYSDDTTIMQRMDAATARALAAELLASCDAVDAYLEQSGAPA